MLPGSTEALTFIFDPNEFPDLGDLDLSAIWGPEFSVVQSIYSTGWGPDGSGAAILTLAEGAGGLPYWHGMIYAGPGF